MKKYLFSIVAAIGLFVAYQSVNFEAKAQKPEIEIGKPCMCYPNSWCVYISEWGNIEYIDPDPGKFLD